MLYDRDHHGPVVLRHVQKRGQLLVVRIKRLEFVQRHVRRIESSSTAATRSIPGWTSSNVSNW